MATGDPDRRFFSVRSACHFFFSLLCPAGLHDPCCFTAGLLVDKKEADHFEAGFSFPGYPGQDALPRYLS
jgi:hypothetical protein